MSSDWTTRYKYILDHYHQDIVTADSPQALKRMMKKIRKAILEAQKELEDEDVPLPTSLKKVTKF